MLGFQLCGLIGLPFQQRIHIEELLHDGSTNSIYHIWVVLCVDEVVLSGFCEELSIWHLLGPTSTTLG